MASTSAEKEAAATAEAAKLGEAGSQVTAPHSQGDEMTAAGAPAGSTAAMVQDSAQQKMKQQTELLAMLEEAYGPTIWEGAAGASIPADAWEYHIRKSLNDAAFQTLDYVPYSSTMPVQKTDPNPKFIWKRKERS